MSLRARRGERAARLALVTLGLHAAATTTAHADAGAAPPSPPVVLAWSASPECGSAPETLDDVARILARASGPGRRIVARVALRQEESGAWRVELQTEAGGAPHARAFVAESCDAAEDAVALILAIAVNPRASAPADPSPAADPSPPLPLPAAPAAGAPPPSLAPRADEPGPALALAPAPSAPRETPASPASRGARGDASTFAVSASFVTDVGTLPRAAVGGEIELGWRARGWGLELAGAAWTVERATAATGTGGADFQLLSADARASYAWTRGSFALGPLVDGGVGHVRAAGFGGSVGSFGQEAWLPVFGGGGLASWRPFGPVAVRLLVEAVVEPSRPSFVVAEAGGAPAQLVHRPSTFAGRGGLGVEVHFP